MKAIKTQILAAHGNCTCVNAFKTLPLTQGATRFSSKKNPIEKLLPYALFSLPKSHFFSVLFPLVFCNPPLPESTDPQPLLKLLSPFRFFHSFSPVSSSLSYPLFFQLLSIFFFVSPILQASTCSLLPLWQVTYLPHVHATLNT